MAGVDLTRIDGISAGAAQTVITEVGLDLGAFPTETHFVSWPRLCPRTAVSGGKALPHKKTQRHRREPRGGGAAHGSGCATALAQRAGSGVPSHGKLQGPLGLPVFALARKLAIRIYRMLRYGEDYLDIGELAYESRFRRRCLAALGAAAKSLGYGLVE